MNIINIRNTFILLLVFVNIFLLRTNLLIKKQINERNNYSVHDRVLELRFEEGKLLNMDVKLIDNEGGKDFILKDILNNNAMLILYYNNKSCYACIDNVIKTLESMVDSFQFIEKNLTILSDDYHSFTSHDPKTSFTNYKIIEGELGLNNTDLEEPFLFLLDKSCASRLLIIPMQYSKNELARYLELIENKFFKNS